MCEQQYQAEVMDECRRLAETGEMTEEQEREYAEFLMSQPELHIGNGDMLIEYMEDSRYFDEFVTHYCTRRAQARRVIDELMGQPLDSTFLRGIK